MRVLHAYKIYRPDVYGGIPHVMSTLSDMDGMTRDILVARRVGMGRRFWDGTDRVTAVSSLGTLFSTPVAPTYVFALAQMARAVDLVVHHAPFPLVDLGLSGGLPPTTALVVHWHAEMVTRPFLAKLIAPLVRRTLQRADRIIVSDSVIIQNSEFLPGYERKCVVLPYGCDTDFWARSEELGDQSRPLPGFNGSKRIVSVGRLVAYKGFEVLLRALPSLDAHAVIIGDGPLRPSLEEKAKALGVKHKVSFAGNLSNDEVRQYLQAADVFAFPSMTCAEAFGLVQIEAMAAGLPIVNTSLKTAVPFVARHNREALTVPPGDSVALADALRRILEDPQLAYRLGRAGADRARSDFDQRRFVAQIRDVYKEAVASRQLPS